MEDKITKVGDLYAELGAVASRLAGPGEQQVVVYVEAGRAWCGISLYKNEPDRIAYLDEDVEDANLLADIVMEIWNADDSNKRWVEMCLDIDGNQFKAQQFYADNLNKREDYGIRRERAARERFGDKPIYYAPLGIEE